MWEQIQSQALVYGFILVRVMAILLAMPSWSGRLPVRWKLLAAVWLSVLFSFIVPPDAVPRDLGLYEIVVGILREVLTGALLGFLIRLFLAAVALAGQLAGFQMGLAIANVIDPATSARYSIIAQWMNLLALFVFLEMDGHLMAVRVLAGSFGRIPPFSAQMSGQVFYDLVWTGGGEMFRLALRIAWPVCLALLLAYLAMALLVRVAPMINILMVGFPITILVGLIVLFWSVPSFTGGMEHLFRDAFVSAERVMAMLGG